MHDEFMQHSNNTLPGELLTFCLTFDLGEITIVTGSVCETNISAKTGTGQHVRMMSERSVCDKRGLLLTTIHRQPHTEDMSLEHHPLSSLLPSPDLAPFPLSSTLLPFLPYCVVNV